MRIFIISAISLVLILLFPLLVTIFLTLAPSCENEVLDRVASPDKARAAVVYSVNCGATTGYSYHVSILPNGTALKRPGNILVADKVAAYSDRLKPSWQGNKAITVPIPHGARVFSKKDFVHDVKISFPEE